VPYLKLTCQDLKSVMRACAWVRLPRRTPLYFRTFVVERLRRLGCARLAFTVARLDTAHFELLCDHLRERQPTFAWVRPGVDELAPAKSVIRPRAPSGAGS
jgi:hypothetical protein